MSLRLALFSTLIVVAMHFVAPASVDAQVPARPADPDAEWLTHEQALAIHEQAYQDAIARGELRRRESYWVTHDSTPPETLFELFARPYPGAPRWDEPEAAPALLAGKWEGSQVDLDFGLSADGRWIVMARAEFPYNELFLIEARTGAGWRLRHSVETLEFLHPEFSPIEDVIAVAVHAMPREGLGEIWLIDLNATLVDRIVTPRHAPITPEFSPDGRLLAFRQTAQWETSPGASGIFPEYAGRNGASYQPVVVDLRTKERWRPTNAIFRGNVNFPMVFSSNGRSLVLPTSSGTFVGPRVSRSSNRVFHTSYARLPSDASEFARRVDVFSYNGARSGLQISIFPRDGPVISKGPVSEFQSEFTRLIDTVAGHLLYYHSGEPVTREGELLVFPQTLTLETADGDVDILRAVPAELFNGRNAKLISARLSEDLCTLAYYETDTRERPVIRIVPLCTDEPEFLIDVEAASAELTPLVTGWEMINE